MNSQHVFIKCRNDIVLFATKYLKLDLYPCQKEALRNMQCHRKFLLNSTRRGGKTLLSNVHALWKALFYDNTKVGIVNFSYNMSELGRKGLERLWEKLPNSMKLYAGPIDNNRTKVTFQNGSSIVYLGATSHKICGYNFDVWDVQEVDSIDKNTLRDFIPVMFYGSKHCIFSGTKLDKNGYFYRLYLGSKNPKHEWFSQSINWWDIPSLAPEWAAGMEFQNSELFKREFTADFPIEYPVKDSLVEDYFIDWDGNLQILCQEGLLHKKDFDVDVVARIMEEKLWESRNIQILVSQKDENSEIVAEKVIRVPFELG